jgi:hypothetical protein
MNVTIRDILDEVRDLVEGEKLQEYGDAYQMHENISVGWSQLLDINISPPEVALMMIWMKVCRAKHKLSRDSLKDIIGYAFLIDKMCVWETQEEPDAENGSDPEVTTPESKSVGQQIRSFLGSSS